MAIETQFRPTTEEVAAYIKNRTDDGNNNFLGDFTSDTVVTDDEVNLLIDQTGELVLAALRWDPLLQAVSIPESNWPAVKTLVALFAAISVEVTKFSEQIARQVSPYSYLKEMFDKMLAEKQAELGITPPVTGSGGASGLSLVDLIAKEYGRAIFNFPDDPMINWKTPL
jgi:hypothetical protein